ncbi:hypothetical protein LZ30DRAFT_684044 [Colletotrichum cereale]|nr:hypothetical protein LZ30DRAFT_684044 [Colletotrichum cereale]
MPCRREATKPYLTPDVAPKPRGRKKAGPDTGLGAKDEVSASADFKKKAKATRQPEKTTKRKAAATTSSPPAKRQKTAATNPTETKPTTSESIDTNLKTPKNTGLASQESSKPLFRTFPETPTRTTSKVSDNAMHKMDESDSDLEPQTMAVHGSSGRRFKAEINRLKSQIKNPKRVLFSNSSNRASKETHQYKDGFTTDNTKVNHVFDVPKGHMLISKADYSTLMRRTVTVNKMVMTFTASAGDIEDTKVDKNPALTYLLAEARSLSLGVQSLTNAVTKLPVTRKDNDAFIVQGSTQQDQAAPQTQAQGTKRPTRHIAGPQSALTNYLASHNISADQIRRDADRRRAAAARSREAQNSTLETMPLTMGNPFNVKVKEDKSTAAKEVAEHTKKLPVEKPGDDKDDTGADLSTPNKRIVIKVSKEA